MSDTLHCPHCGAAVPPAAHLYTYIRLRCECGGLFCIVGAGAELATEAREKPGDAAGMPGVNLAAMKRAL